MKPVLVYIVHITFEIPIGDSNGTEWFNFFCCFTFLFLVTDFCLYCKLMVASYGSIEEKHFPY